MALTLQSVANDSAIDVRQVLISNAAAYPSTDFPLFSSWIDRIHKDCMHSSVYSYLNINTTSITTAIGQGSYNLTPTNIRRILGVFDFTRQRILFPIERATSPLSQVEKQEPGAGQQGAGGANYTVPAVSPISLQVGQPAYFRHIGAQGLNLYPTPQVALQLNISFEQQVVTLVNATDQLLIPEDGRDMVVAGVNWLANVYLKRAEEAQAWAQIYNMLKTGQTLV